jgi:4-hydroxy-3-polyprenylbenzoate decarboxylase
MKHIIFAVTGGSGAPIASRTLELLLAADDVRVTMMMSDYARDVFRAESGIDLGKTQADLAAGLAKHFKLNSRFELMDIRNMAARVSSGSVQNEGMIIAPCSMSSLGTIANGITMNLIHRAANVMLKEKRQLIVVPRESPYSPIHLKNMLELAQYGVHIVPATTAFYHNPKTVGDMVDFVVMKVLDLAGVAHGLDKRWKGIEAD